jgi:hypothetical protein
MNGLLAFAHWLQNSPWGLSVAGSEWSYPVVQMTHFVGLSLWVGTNIALDLRLMGVGKGRQTPGELSDALFIWNWIGLAIAVTGGFLLFCVAAGGYVVNPAFQLKLGLLLPLGLILHIIVQRKSHAWSATPEPPRIAKLAGLTEFVLWFAVATAAVAIPYF